MAIDKIIKCRVRYVGNNLHTAQGYETNTFYWILIKQKGEGFIVKRTEELVKGESRIEFTDLDELLNKFDICSRIG